MEYSIRQVGPDEYPPQLLEIPDIPRHLFAVGAPLDPHARYLSVIGSRTHSAYGGDACRMLIRGLAGSDIVIVSGLALGIDSIAHRAALEAGLRTVAFPGSGLGEQSLYPATNLSLAREILAAGGTLVSEQPVDFRAVSWNFPRRNRLMAGIAQAVLIVEAAEKSGTLITANLALDYNRNVLVVPGPITSLTSIGSNLLMKQGAAPITRSKDILEVFGLAEGALGDNRAPRLDLLSAAERALMELLIDPLPRDELLAASGMSISEFNTHLSVMELEGLIKEEYGVVRRI